MKYLKWLPLLPVAAFPYLYFVINRLALWDPWTKVVVGWFVCLAGAAVVYLTRNRWTGRELALANLIIKLIHIPAYVLWFAVGIATLLLLGPVIAFVMDVMAIALSGIVGLAAVLNCRKEGLWALEKAGLYGILQFVFCADVFCAVWIYHKSRKSKENLS